MRRKLILLLSLLSVVRFAAAQSPEPPSTDDVQKFMQVMRIERQMDTMLQIMTASAKQGARTGFLKKMPNATPEQIADVESLTDTLFSDFPINDLMNDIIPVYQKHISKSDLQALTEFYSSPVGQRFLDEQPNMMKEMGTLSAARMQQRMAVIMEKYEARLNELTEKWKKESSDKSKPTPPQEH